MTRAQEETVSDFKSEDKKFLFDEIKRDRRIIMDKCNGLKGMNTK